MSLEVRNLSYSFKNNLLIKGLNFKIEKNEIGFVSGSSGVGKSTLLNIISGLKKPDSGSIICNNDFFFASLQIYPLVIYLKRNFCDQIYSHFFMTSSILS